MTLEENLISALRGVESAFSRDELAYLALTQKVEQAFRDKLAFVLHQRLDNSRFLVCREWKRADLAVLEGGRPVLILEAKAGYTFDILNDKGYDFQNLVAADLKKTSILISKLGLDTSPSVYALVIATHPSMAPHDRFSDAIKYLPGITRFANASNNRESVCKRMDLRMSAFELVDTHETCAGAAFGVKVTVYSWLYRARAFENLIDLGAKH
ncbi:hypothetical protein [Janthinobacterium sp.]|uniref:hypothetical protein n=1 Tax=Janthinobacterium sp. TaxID=1871054 RepID=UPI0025872B9B|nr:hypothetical protein [Janthinobacterium sp.]MCX7292769.1 hypothetical protein [Janthinobacterium sp.]